MISSKASYPTGQLFLSLLLNTMVTFAFLTSDYPLLYIRSRGFFTLANLAFLKDNPNTKNIASNTFDFPVPFSPVRQLKNQSKSRKTVLLA